MDGCSVLLPTFEQSAIPRAIVHFLGGFVAGSAVAYGETLSDIADAGYLVVVSPIPAVQTNHSSIATDVATTFAQCYKNRLLPLMGWERSIASSYYWFIALVRRKDNCSHAFEERFT